jgi:hypothetical protein
VSLCFRERRRLDRIADTLLATDPRLAALLAEFEVVRLGQPLPRWEQQRRRLLTWIGSGLLWIVFMVISPITHVARGCRRRLRRPRRYLRNVARARPGGTGTARPGGLFPG